MNTIPTLITDNKEINIVYRMAIGDLYSNVSSFKDGLLENEAPVLLAGVGYVTPWTRDCAINVWNGAGLIMPEIAKNTLLSTVIEDGGKKRIGGQYWDAIIWAVGAYSYYKYTGDEDFKPLMTDVIKNSLEYFEATELDEELNLFRGAACYGDGTSAYPDAYVTGEACILSFIEHKREQCVKIGEGIPAYCLSTNCLYHEAYKIIYILTGQEVYLDKALTMKKAINKHFWSDELGRYKYIVDKFGGCDYSEGMGQSFAMLFGIANEEKAKKIIENQYISPQGIPCVYPVFERYKDYGTARHAGTVWPQVQTFWADAAARYDMNKFDHELSALTANVLRDGYFSEIYHPETGERFGGFQEWHGNIVEWKSEIRQLWCATGYVRMVLLDLLGMSFEEDGIYVKPLKTSLCKKIELRGLKYRNCTLNITVTGENYERKVFVPSNSTGEINIVI